jgi:hypothetical protein
MALEYFSATRAKVCYGGGAIRGETPKATVTGFVRQLLPLR